MPPISSTVPMLLLLLPLLLLGFTACLESEPDEVVDLEPPVVGANGSSSAIAPAHFLVVDAEAAHIPLAFDVTDDRGLSEVVIESHNGFDGHLHGRGPESGPFVLLNYRETIGEDELAGETRYATGIDDDTAIYLDERNPNIPADARVLAGPYHFSVKAVDASGNETSYDDNSTYHSTIYLQRSYAPAVEDVTVDRDAGTVTGSVGRNLDDEASSEIVFLWVAVVRPDPTRPAQEGEFRREWLWGESNWPHQFRADSGAPLPDDTAIDLAALAEADPAIQSAIRAMAPGDLLRVWAEDANGNITLRNFD